MHKKLPVILVGLTLLLQVLAQEKPQASDQAIRISTTLVQLDVVVTDKKGLVVSDLTKEDFELVENGKKQHISFIEFVEASKGRPNAGPAKHAAEPINEAPSLADVRRTFAFVVDDLTIRNEDLAYVRDMLTNFLENRMQAGDLIAIVRTIGGKGLYQQFTSDKQILRRAVALLTPRTDALRVFGSVEPPTATGRLLPAGDTASAPIESFGEVIDIDNPTEDTKRSLRAYMSLGLASFVVDSMRQLPGRKSLVLISGGLPSLQAEPGVTVASVTRFLDVLTDKAARAGVAIHTLDIRGLEGERAVATFDDTPGRSALPSTMSDLQRTSRTGRQDDVVTGYRGQTTARQGLRSLASSTGGIAVLNKNDFDEGLQKILDLSQGYYVLAYTPSDPKFDDKFRKLEVKVKREGVKVYSRRGYFAKEEKRGANPETKQEQLLAAIASPLARRDIEVDAMLIFKAGPQNQGALDIFMVIDPSKLRFDDVDGKKQSNFDVAGFVFDELGKLRGGFSETIVPSLSAFELASAEGGGLLYPASTQLPPGAYQVRLAVRDNKTGAVGTLSRYLEVPDLSKGRLSASSLMIGGADPGEANKADAFVVSANRRVPQSQDLRYLVVIYNAKLKNGKPSVSTELTISRQGQVVHSETGMATEAGDQSTVIMGGRLSLKKVNTGRYTLGLRITDLHAEKGHGTVTRSMDFIVIE
jgi:VWFA-related protein